MTEMELVVERCAGIDVHQAPAACLRPVPRGRLPSQPG
jgi:hypothetical protein